MEPHLESAVIAIVRRMILAGLERHAWRMILSRQLDYGERLESYGCIIAANTRIALRKSALTPG